MAKGENIFKRKDGRWEARYIKGYEISGKAKYGYCYGRTYREAKEKVTRAKAALLAGRPQSAAHSKKRFAYYCDEWFLANKEKLKESTCVKYETILERHIKPKLGDCVPLAMGDALAEQFETELLKEGLAPKTVKDILVVLHSILKFTAKRYPGTFQQVEITYPKETKKEVRVLSGEEQARFVRYLLEDMDECKFGILLALLTGLRVGEICALRWENISVEEKIMKISATMQRLKNQEGGEDQAKTKILIGTPKSETSARTIPMSEDAAALCRKMQPGDAAAFVLTGTEKYMEPRAIQYRLKKYTKECGLEGVHFHTLRHTFATRCVEVGFELKSLSEILGHASTAITLERYVHSSMKLKRENMNKLSMIAI